MTNQRECPRDESGFTLLEVLVALAIVGIAGIVMFQLFSTNLKALAVSEDYVAAVVRAEARMREVLSKDELAEDAWSETTNDGYRIDVAVSEVVEERTDELPVRLLEVVLTIHWEKHARQRSLTVRTMKLVRRKV
jgi:prepilin-type N-terminal cleavage/methylation domain-containing protein